MLPQDVIAYWFEELSDEDRWTRGKLLDRPVTERFGTVHEAASVGELWEWRNTPVGRLAEIIVLDQFSRHIYRNAPAAFACDPVALVLAQEAVRQGADQAVGEHKRLFFYMPFMHSESVRIHERARELFSRLGNTLKYEDSHRAIVERFGRYPHRNGILGRPSTPEEIEFLKEPGSSFL